MNKLLSLLIIIAVIAVPAGSFAQPLPEASFFIEPSFHAGGQSQIPATLKNVSDEAYFYVEDSFFNSLDSLQQIELTKSLVFLGDEFDKNIYHEIRSLYGEEHNPEPKITVLIADLSPNIAAFVDPSDIFPQSEVPFSNERAMIYMNSSIIFSDAAKHHLAHEFAHVIESNQKERLRGISEEKWLSEALAEYATTRAGYNDTYQNSYLQDRVEDYIANPSTPLTFWSGIPADFGASALFAHYLADHYGEGFLRSLMRSGASGRQNITQALQNRGEGETFADVYARWTVANYINTSAINEQGNTDERYSYKNPNLSISNFRVPNSAEVSVFPGSQTSMSFMLTGGGTQWVRLLPGSLDNGSGGALDIEFAPTERFDGDFRISYITTHISGETKVGYINQSNETEFTVENFGDDVLSAIIVISNMAESDIAPVPSAAVYNLSLSMEGDEVITPPVQEYPDGALLRAVGDPKVYVIKGNTKRWIPSSSVFNGYGHLSWQSIIDVPAHVLDGYTESRLIRFAGDPRVFQINPTGRMKQWLNITPAQFDASGRNWNAIYEVNQNEFNFYQTGASLSQ